jgi:hypothetical protein
MLKHHPPRSVIVYVGFLNGRPHVEQEGGARVIAAYTSKAAAKRAYADVRRARMIFDANWRGERT